MLRFSAPRLADGGSKLVDEVDQLLCPGELEP